jgi:hypothetical protein
VVYWLRKYLLKVVAIEPFLTLGKASLRVFCAHIFFVFVGLALLYGDVEYSNGVPQLHGPVAIALLTVTFTALILVAANEVRKKRATRTRAGGSAKPAPNSDAGTRESGLWKRSEPEAEATALMPALDAREPVPATLASIEEADLYPPPG